MNVTVRRLDGTTLEHDIGESPEPPERILLRFGPGRGVAWAAERVVVTGEGGERVEYREVAS